MEQHPVPRNITGFQFRLIGDMTVKQFGYLAVGAILAYLFFRAPFPGILRLPLAVATGFLGVAFAFIPIQERPLDQWLAAFIRSVYSPTQFVWGKMPELPEVLKRPQLASTPRLPSSHVSHFEESKKKLEDYLKTLPTSPSASLDKEENQVLTQTLSLFYESKKTPPSPLPPEEPYVPLPPLGKPLEKEKPLAPLPKKKVEVAPPQKEKEEVLSPPSGFEKTLEALRIQLADQKISRERFLEIQSQLTSLLKEKERLGQELISLRKRFETRPKEAPVTPTTYLKEEQQPTVKIISPTLAPKVGLLSISQVPNVVCGIIIDGLGNLLPGILVTVKNQTGLTLRALKTNRLGQFASSTPLPNGTYTIEVEDPKRRFQFDIIEVTLRGDIFSPLEILAKGERELTRERLTKDLFGTQEF